MKLSINPNIIDKNILESHQSKGFVSVDITPRQLADHITQGHALSYQFRDSYRKANNFLCTDFIGADFDRDMTLDEAFSNVFFQQYACLLYTTASHTPEAHRFRVIFETPQTLTDREQVRCAQRGLVRKFLADAAATDPARQFYGSRTAAVHFFNGRLDDMALAELVKLGEQPLRRSDSAIHGRIAGARSNTLFVALDQLITLADGTAMMLKDIDSSRSVYCPFHADRKPSAFTTRSKKGTPGIHCASCQLTFWPSASRSDNYNFLAFDDMAREAYARPKDVVVEPGTHIEIELPNPNLVFSDRFLPSAEIDLFEGVTLIKSPKGSGKTEYLSQVLRDCERLNLRVLMVGHRRSLLRALSERLNLACYLDDDFFHKTPRLAMSVDSLPKMLAPAVHRYDVVILDESEQVFSHLIADTMDNERRRNAYLLLRHYLQAAQQVIALDADLNQVTLHATERKNDLNPLQQRRFILNHCPVSNRTVELYGEEEELVGQMFTDIAAGRRLFVCCNSKARVEKLVASIEARFGASVPLYWITSQNSMTEETRHFIANIKTEILRYQVVAVSPAMGTGIDITFDGGETQIDGVYGIFNPLINTHYDIDQQLSRVRHPGCVRVWISPQRFDFETEVEPIQQELATSGLFPELLKGYDRRGVAQYDWGDPFTLLHAHILSSQRASKNHQRKHFIDLREYNGWTVVDATPDRGVGAIGAAAIFQGIELRQQRRAEALMAARELTPEEVDVLMAAREQEEIISAEDQYALDRYFMERFYCEPLTPALIAIDEEGYFRDKLRLLEHVLDSARDICVAHLPLNLNLPENLLFHILRQANLFTDDGELNTEATITLSRLQTFTEYCRANKAKIERVLMVEIRRDLEKKPMQQLTKFLGLCGLGLMKTGTFTSGKSKIYEYGLPPERLEYVMAFLDTRLKAYPHRRVNLDDTRPINDNGSCVAIIRRINQLKNKKKTDN